jgi:hypothetical protein
MTNIHAIAISASVLMLFLIDMYFESLHRHHQQRVTLALKNLQLEVDRLKRKE